ncbi:unnamed protein product, partial [Porites evermanni]
AVVAVNLLSIILFAKNSNLRTRAMYLVINLTVVDMFVGLRWLSNCCLCLIVICVSYTSIALKVLCGTRPPSHGAAIRQRKLTVTLFITTLVSLLLLLPYVIYIFVSFSVIPSLVTFFRL